MNKQAQVLVGVAVVLLLGVGVWWGVARKSPSNTNQTNTTNQNVNTVVNNVDYDTAQWKTYTNNKFSYSFKYPQTWNLLDSPDSSIPDPNDSHIGFGDSHTDFRISALEVTDCSTLSECSQKHPYAFSGQYNSEGTLESTTISGKDAITTYRQRTDSGMWRYRVYYVLHNATFFTIDAYSYPGSDTETDQLIKTIVASFLFSK